MKRAAMVVSVLAGMLSFATHAQAAAPAWKVLAVAGPTHMQPFSSEMQSVTLRGGGTFTLTHAGDTTVAIPADASAAGVETALNALPSIGAGGGSVSVSEAASSPDALPNSHDYVVTFDGGPLAGTDVAQLTAAASGDASVSVGPTPSGEIVVFPTNVGGASTDGTPIVAELELPAGITPVATAECPVAGQSVTCSRTVVVASATSMGPGAAPSFRVPVVLGPAAPASASVDVEVSGGGAAPVVQPVSLIVSAVPAAAGVQALWAGAFDEDGMPFVQAGGHPARAGFGFRLNSIMSPWRRIVTVGDVRNLDLELPPGFIGNPLVTQRCPESNASGCPGVLQTVVGGVGAMVQGHSLSNGGPTQPLVNGEPPRGYAAQFSFVVLGTTVRTVGFLRSDDFGVTASSPNIPNILKASGAVAMVEGSPPTANGKAFWTNPTDCPGEVLPTRITADTWQATGIFSSPLVDASPAVTGCDSVPFEPLANLAGSAFDADSATGLTFDLSLPQDNLLDPDEIATSHLKDVVVDLPAGLSVNPSGATGLEGCTDAQMAVGQRSAPNCPDGSKLGTVEVTSPLVDHPIGGTMYLGTPKSTDPSSGEMLRLFVVARDDETGTMVKLPGSATADPQTGKLVATFRNNPRVPFDHLTVRLRGGDRGLLANPQRCGSSAMSATLSPWSGTVPVSQDSPLDVSGDCDFGFAPALTAGVSTRQARDSGTFSFEFTRPQGDQTLSGLTAKLPQGLLASLKGVPLCQDTQAAAGVCPAGSKIGMVDASAGSGDPFVLEEKGEVFLTEGYKGGAYGLAVKVRGVAGPFRGSQELSPIVVRQALHVDRTTAQVTAVSDPLPQIHHGVPLRVRRVTVLIDRPGFMLNPSDCAPKQIDATLSAAQGATAGLSNPFGTTGCAALPFKPKLTLALTGKRQVTTGKHPGVKAKVNQAGIGEAGIEQAVVRLPKSLALDPNNAQALCEFEDGTKPDLENHCPKGSIVGRARAITPLLNQPLAGNVYFVKNVRRDPNTGNLIRTLPMLIVALRGEIAINLKGESSTTKGGKLVNTFASVPDGPISRFNLNIRGGKNGILAVTRTRRAKINLCAGRHIAEVDNDGQNGRRHDFNVRMKTPCTKRQTRKAKRAAKKAARKARNARR